MKYVAIFLVFFYCNLIFYFYWDKKKNDCRNVTYRD